jgi:Domain of unknown function (DUF4190)
MRMADEQPPPPPPPPPPPQSGWSQTPAAPGYGYRPPQTEGMAIAAFVCAIAAFVVCPVIPAIVALVLAHNAQQKIDASGGYLTGDGFNTAARVISWVHLALAALAIVILVAIAAAGGFDTDDDLDEFDSSAPGVTTLR